MDIRLAKTAGFCFGVQRAVEKVYQQVKEGKNHIYTYGPIIHNEEVVTDLEEKGVKVINSLEELKTITEGIIIIRSHGVSKDIYNAAEKQGLEIIDATCPFVLKIHNIVEKESAKGNEIVIIGSAKHPEVEGINGWSSTPTTIIHTAKDAHDYMSKSGKTVCIVAQTTFNYIKFQELVEIISKKGYDRIVLNTICNATWERQTEAQVIAKEVEAMIVIGGKHSSNTQKLYEICQRECENTYYIQTLEDLDLNSLGSIVSVGITAGASTPNNIIEEVQKNVRIKF